MKSRLIQKKYDFVLDRKTSYSAEIIFNLGKDGKMKERWLFEQCRVHDKSLNKEEQEVCNVPDEKGGVCYSIKKLEFLGELAAEIKELCKEFDYQETENNKKEEF